MPIFRDFGAAPSAGAEAAGAAPSAAAVAAWAEPLVAATWRGLAPSVEEGSSSKWWSGRTAQGWYYQVLNSHSSGDL